MEGAGFALMVMLAVEESLQPLLFVSTTFKLPEPDDPHLTLIEFVPAPELMVPPEIVQA